ncbi:four-carbon acid sugar kinase family protein [Alcaligenaceae bacterium]|uniref:four-carbon acid sugar kinase family protein n=1 Tax=Parapusillimonas sp. JC17 TaxID=3445768 RepID=UPI0015D2306A|nr:four-carbon acid sugar kinase family protein [Alcaligenaceae bacterium]
MNELSKQTPQVGFYADDFTGASANLMEFHRLGLNGVLFVNTPTIAQIDRYGEKADVLGVAGTSRSLEPSGMITEMQPALELFKRIGCRVIQYKICSTFDSSPKRGNFGTVIDLARSLYGKASIPIVAAHPTFGRYTAFGTHFAVHDGTTYRLDRHPSMSCHPATPMNEADLRRHLALQTSLPLGLCDVLTLRAKTESEISAMLDQQGMAAIVFDAMEHADLVAMAAGVWEASRRRTVFTIGSHGFAAGLATHLSSSGPPPARPSYAPQKPVESLVVLSGSCSPRTAMQITHARENGWKAIRLPIDALTHESEDSITEKIATEIVQATSNGQSIVIYAAAGPQDTAIASGRGVFETIQSESSAVIGRIYGSVLTSVMKKHRLPRIMLAGGDTSSQTIRALGIEALTIDAINRASTEAFMTMHCNNPLFDGVQLLMKAGQNGSDDYFSRAREGTQWQ